MKTTRNPHRDTLMFALSFYTGMRVGEISKLRWNMLIDEWGDIRDFLIIPKNITKGAKVDRYLPASRALKKYISNHMKSSLILKGFTDMEASFFLYNSPVIVSTRGTVFTPGCLSITFSIHYRKSGIKGTSHSGRRTYATNLSRELFNHGGSLEDLRVLLGHMDLKTTQRYLETNRDAQMISVERLYKIFK